MSVLTHWFYQSAGWLGHVPLHRLLTPSKQASGVLRGASILGNFRGVRAVDKSLKALRPCFTGRSSRHMCRTLVLVCCSSGHRVGSVEASGVPGSRKGAAHRKRGIPYQTPWEEFSGKRCSREGLTVRLR